MGQGGPERLSNLPKVTELVGRRAGFVPGGQAAESARSIFCQGWWAVGPELLVALSPHLRAFLRMKGKKEKAEPGGGERQTADTF